MKIFISHRTTDTEEVDSLISGISCSEFLSHRTLELSDDIWKDKVKSKMAVCNLYFIKKVMF